MILSKKIQRMLAMAAMGTLLSMGSLSAAGIPAELDGDTVEYDMNTGIISASGDVLMKHGDAMVAGAKATYNSKTQQGSVTGNVIATQGSLHMTAGQVTLDGTDHITASGGVTAVKDDMNLRADSVVSEGQNHFIAVGNVQGKKADKTFAGPKADYQQDINYVVIENGGTITSADGTFTANRMEGWLNENRFKGEGNAHIVSPARDFEGGGDIADYYGQDGGKAILDGNAWAIQGNNTLKSNHLTVYLAQDGSTRVE